jgi:hypothetical protein
MKRFLTVISAAAFAVAVTAPVFAQSDSGSNNPNSGASAPMGGMSNPESSNAAINHGNGKTMDPNAWKSYSGSAPGSHGTSGARSNTTSDSGSSSNAQENSSAPGGGNGNLAH